MNLEEYLQSFSHGKKKQSLETMEYFMKKLNNPQEKQKFIHIAGTNGKGSCTEMMANILLKSGYKVGKFISPHLIKYNERISVNNINISNEKMEKIIEEIDPLIMEYGKENVTLFELETIMAIIYFYRKKCDIVVMEVGLGGMYDCTNIIYPEISVINSIGYDHMQFLGNTIEEIAYQKAGIIKENSKTVYICQENEADNVIINKCKEENNKLYLIKREDVKNYSYNNEFQEFDYKDYKNIRVKLKGKSQIYNASICLEAVNILKDNYKLPEEKVREGIESVIHRGRFETLWNEPTIIYDGGHNELAIKNFINSVNMYYKDNKKVYIISLLKSKDYKTILKLLVQEKNGTYIFTSGNSEERYWDKEILKEEAIKLGAKNAIAINLEGAINKSFKEYKNYIIFVIGSFYIYGDVINYIQDDAK